MRKSVRKKIASAVLIALGSVSLGLGAVGIFLPILPTVPFLLLTLVCYAKGSPRFERWFVSTRVYKKRLEAFVKTRAMTNAGKARTLLFIAALISVPIILVDVLPMRIVLGAVILFHFVYFIFFVKSVSKARLAEMLSEIKAKEAAEKASAETAPAEMEVSETPTAEIEAAGKGQEQAIKTPAPATAETSGKDQESAA